MAGIVFCRIIKIDLRKSCYYFCINCIFLCDRYHNARSKLLLHTSIHIGHANNDTLCSKCHKNITDDPDHINTCSGKTEQEEHLKSEVKQEVSRYKSNKLINLVASYIFISF